jgi:TDG/mug DNA glycosylase family protein
VGAGDHRAQRRSRRSQPVPDVLRSDLDLLLIGINPGLISAQRQAHFANPANPFWRLLHESGFVDRRLTPAEGRALLDYGLGVTNLVARETAGVADLTRAELEAGRLILARKIRRHRPRAVVFVGITAYAAFTRPRRGRVECGEQAELFAGARVFVLPNPSGRNAHFTRAQMLEAFRSAARALGR